MIPGVASGSVQRYDGKRGTVWRIVYRPHKNAPQRRETVPGARNERDAERYLRQRLSECENGEYTAPTRLTFGEYADRFMRDHAEVRLRGKTVADYRGMLKNHVKPELGKLALEDITPLTIDQYVARKVRQGRLSPKTVNNHIRLLNVMFAKAVRWRLLRINSARDVEKLKVDEPETDTLSPAECRTVIDKAPPLVGLFVLLTVLTGARRNEALSLTWDRFDEAGAKLRIDRQWIGDGWAPLKSRKRTHALPAELWQRLIDHHEAAPYDAPEDFIFATVTGKPIDGRNMLRWFKDAAAAAKTAARVPAVWRS